MNFLLIHKVNSIRICGIRIAQIGKMEFMDFSYNNSIIISFLEHRFFLSGDKNWLFKSMRFGAVKHFSSGLFELLCQYVQNYIEIMKFRYILTKLSWKVSTKECMFMPP